MAFNGNGVFNRLYSWVADRNANIKIQAARTDAEFDGIADGLSQCITRDGQTTTTATIPFAQGIRVWASAPPSPQSGDLWMDDSGLWIRIGSVSSLIQPVGLEAPWGGDAAPAGWVLAYGQALSRTAFARLFALYGTKYGTGDGSTTFNIPDYRGRMPLGRDDMGGVAASRITTAGSGIDGTLLGATGGDQRMPQHNHNVTDPSHNHTVNINSSSIPGGALFGFIAPTGLMNAPGLSVNGNGTGIAVANAGSGTGGNVPPAIVRNWIIYAGG